MTIHGLNDVVAQTQAFMALHWDFPGAPTKPTWSPPWLLRDPMPHHDKQGCYALFAGEELIYIGVGAGARPYHYPGHGLGGRISNYIMCVKRGARGTGVGAVYAPNRKWHDRGMDSIQTIGFPGDYAYLAYALEAYLIARLQPRYNSMKPGAPQKPTARP